MWNDDWDGSPLVVADYLYEGGENSQFHVVKLNRTMGADGMVQVDPDLVFNAPGWDDELLGALNTRNNDVSIENSVAYVDGVVYFANSGGLVQGWDVSGVADGVDADPGVPVLDRRRRRRLGGGRRARASCTSASRTSGATRGPPRSASCIKLDPRQPDDPLVWSVKDPRGFWTTPALHDDVVIAASDGGTVYGVDRATGAVRWTFPLPPPTWQSAVIVDDTLIQGDCEGGLHAYDVSDTTVAPPELWSVSLEGCIESTPAVWKGRLFVGARGGRFYAIGDGLNRRCQLVSSVAGAPSRRAGWSTAGRSRCPTTASTLLAVLRERLGLTSVKDGCSPQGQCGCCTVLVDGQPRVACVTPARRVRGRSVTTLDGLDPGRAAAWGEAFCATGASQCGFCTPGIVVRLAGLAARSGGGRATTPRSSRRCWPTSAGARAGGRSSTPGTPTRPGRPSDPTVTWRPPSARATIEGRSPQRVAPDVALGHGGFADDGAPADALVAVPDGAGGWAVGETLDEARAAAGKVQGRRTTVDLRHPLDVPPGDWAATLRTTWVEPAYLELDAAWCAPGGEPATPLANGGAFGGKRTSLVAAAARAPGRRPRPPGPGRAGPGGRRPPRPQAPPGGRRDPPRRHGGPAGRRHPRRRGRRGRGRPGLCGSSRSTARGPADVGSTSAPPAGPKPSPCWPRVAPADADRVTVRSPAGATATADVRFGDAPEIHVRAACGRPLDDVVLRSYCVGAAHMALGWVCSEGIAVDEAGEVHDLTIRSFGVLRAVDMPRRHRRDRPRAMRRP